MSVPVDDINVLRCVLAGTISEIIGLEMAFNALRANSAPAHEEEIRAVRSADNLGLVHDDLDTVGHAVRSLECRGPRVHRRVTTDGVRVAS